MPITLTLYDGSGNTIEGAALSGTCTQVTGGALSIVSGPSVTDENGESNVVVSAALDAPNGGLSGSCTFTTATGNPSASVSFTGSDSCVVSSPSPAPPAGSCPP